MPNAINMKHLGYMDLLLVPWMFFLLPVIMINSSYGAHGACPGKCSCNTGRGLVNCQNAGLEHIPWDLPSPTAVTDLDLRDNIISEINAQIVYPNLRYLDLSSNRIVRIVEDQLRDLPHLEVLHLKDNRLNLLKQNTFAGLSQLRTLDLSDNDLTNITIPIFSHLQSLEKLTLVGNAIDNISASAFEGLRSLTYLNLEDNRISGISDGLFHHLVSLRTLNLGYNRLTSLSAGAFSHLPNLQEIILESNGISWIAMDAFVPSTSLVSQLKSVNLRNNMLHNVPSDVLVKLRNLEMLDLSQNPISKITSGAFSGLGHLRSLHLNTMPLLHSVYNNAFVDLVNLRKFEMYSNRMLSLLEPRAFTVSSQLRIVDLHANALETLNENMVDWESLKFLDLRYNSWHCDCDLVWLSGVLRLLSVNASLYIAQEVQCYTPSDRESNSVIFLEEELPDCVFDDLVTAKPEIFQDNIMIAIMCSIGGILLIVIVILMCKYGKSYSTAYASTMDQYVYRNPNKVKNKDVENQKVPVIESDMSMARSLRSSMSSNSGIGVPKAERKFTRVVRFAESDSPTPVHT